MTTLISTPEQVEMHRSGRAGWLRAAVLGSDDAIVSTASLMIGVAASSAPKGAILVAGVAGMVAGAMSMAVGEFVSVSSQRDAEQADIQRETGELSDIPSFPYRLLWEERQLVSVANLTRQDGIDFLRLAPAMGIVTQTTRYPLNQANQALADLRAGRFDGAAVLVP
jgi:hypothetical protein